MKRRLGEVGINQRALFHGTKFTNPRQLATGVDGIDPRCTPPGRYYGTGAYFSEDLDYVDSWYAFKVPGHADLYQVIVAHVLCGQQYDFGEEVTRESAELRRPPYIPGTTITYDSVKGGPHRGSYMHVVYSATRSHISYIVTYRKSDTPAPVHP